MFLISLYIIYNYTLLPHLCQVLFLYLDEKAIDFGAYMSLLLYIYVCVSIFLRTCVNILTCQIFDSLNDTLMRQFLDNRQSFDMSKF